MRAQARLETVQRSVIREMARYGQRFTVDGSVLRGPGTTAVAVREHPGEDGAVGHVDLGFVLRLGQADGPVIWDCTAGRGRTEEEKLDSAVRMWATTTAAAVVEMQERRGEHGDHVRPGELPGWHAVQGPAAVFGFGSDRLAEWLAGNQLLPALADALRPGLPSTGVTGVKVFLGGRAGEEVAEVRVDGTVSEPASAALRALGWPRGERLCWARLFVLLVPDGQEAQAVPAGSAPAPGAAHGGPGVLRRGLLARWRQARPGR
ncbi:hypothetical protein KNE206_11650 [Kitasatospora sp. NE20-6]